MADWSIEVAFNAAIDPYGTTSYPPTGFYVLTCAGTELIEGKRIVLQLEVAEDANPGREEGARATGMTLRENLNVPAMQADADSKKHAEGFLKGALVAFGHDKDAIKAFVGTLGPVAFQNRKVHVHCDAPTEALYGDMVYLTPDEYARGLKGGFKPVHQSKGRTRKGAVRTGATDLGGPSLGTGGGLGGLGSADNGQSAAAALAALKGQGQGNATGLA